MKKLGLKLGLKSFANQCDEYRPEGCVSGALQGHPYALVGRGTILLSTVLKIPVVHSDLTPSVNSASGPFHLPASIT